MDELQICLTQNSRKLNPSIISQENLPHYIKLSLYMKIKEITLGGKKEGQAMQSK